MKQIVALFCLLTISSSSFASTLLTCTPTDELARQISSITLKEDGGKLSVEFKVTAQATAVGALAGVSLGDGQPRPVVKVDDNTVSKNYVIDQGPDGKAITSLVANLRSKRAVYLTNLEDTQVIYFLKCQ